MYSVIGQVFIPVKMFSSESYEKNYIFYQVQLLPESQVFG
jgi:hypothetical protein